MVADIISLATVPIEVMIHKEINAIINPSFDFVKIHIWNLYLREPS